MSYLLKKSLVLAAIITLVTSSTVFNISTVTSVTVDPSVQYQTFEGFGTSMAWWGNMIGNLDGPGQNDLNRKLRDEILDLVFSPVNGLGYTICKYYIGACENPNCPHGKHMLLSREMEGYTDPTTRLYDWTRDAAQRYCIQYAKNNYNITRFEANLLSAPYYMTNSGCVSGAITAETCNLKDDCYDDFADYLTEVVKFFKDVVGIEFATISPFGEPEEKNFWKAGGSQEGCYYTTEQQIRFVKSLHKSLTRKGLSTTISVMDAFHINAFNTQIKDYMSAGVFDLLGALGSHAYYGSFSNRTQFRDIGESFDKYTAMTESCHTGLRKVCDYQNMVSPLRMAFQITTDLRDMGVKHWLDWEPINDRNFNERSSSTWGGIHVYYKDEVLVPDHIQFPNRVMKKGEYTVSKQFYAKANYTRFITQGYKIIDANDPYTLTALNPETGNLTVVVYNSTESAKDYIFDLTKFTTLNVTVERHRTTYTQDLEKLVNLSVSNGSFSDNIPAESITTYVIHGAKYVGPMVKNVNDGVVGTGFNKINYVGNWGYYQYPSTTSEWASNVDPAGYFKDFNKVYYGDSGFYGNDNSWTNDAGDYAEIKFCGNQIKFYGEKKPGRGIGNLSVTDLSGKPVADFNGRTVPSFNIDYYSSSSTEGVLLYTSPVLPNGNYMLKITNTGTRNPSSNGTQITVDRFQVISGMFTKTKSPGK